MQNLTLNKQRGAAIIVALFVVALVAAAATIMIERLRTDIRRTELVLNADAAYLYAQGSVLWAIDTLNTNLKNQQPNKVVDMTPIKSAPEKQGGMTISTIIYDAQGFFNINNLSDAQYQATFTRLMQVVAGIDTDNAQNIAFATLDWISPGGNVSAYDSAYAKESSPYRAAHRPMLTASEFRMVYGVTADIYNKISPFITALPQPTPISVNNAPPEILMSLSNTMTADAAKALAATCQRSPYPTTQAFLDSDFVKNNPIDSKKITVTSSYFLVQTNVTLGQQTLILYTLLERTGQGAQINTHVLWQSKGTQ